MNRQTRIEKAIEFNKKFIAGNFVSQKTMDTFVRADELTDEELERITTLYPKYVVGKNYKVGAIFQYNSKLYEVIQEHTSQADWAPDTTKSLYKSKIEEGVVAEFVQPTGGHDAYNIGDRVLFEEKVYESLADANAYSPSAYPQNWKEVV